jgi:hypothetical protein
MAMAKRFSNENIYFVITHKKFDYHLVRMPSMISGHNFSFYAGTPEQIEALHIPKQDIIAVRLAPRFLLPDLMRFCEREGKLVGGIGYTIFRTPNGLMAETNAYFPKDNVDPAFTVVNRYKDLKPKFDLRGVGAPLEAVCANYLEKRFDAKLFSTPHDSAPLRVRQLEKGELKPGEYYPGRVWKRGLGKIIRRRTLPKKPM